MGNPSGDNVIFIGRLLGEASRPTPGLSSSLLELGSRHDGRVDFKYTDPLPPYHFVDLKIAV